MDSKEWTVNGVDRTFTTMAMAQSGTMATTHTGEGVVRRAAFHARRRAEAESDVDDAAMLQEEARRDNVRLVPAEEVEVSEPGANYFVIRPPCCPGLVNCCRTRWRLFPRPQAWFPEGYGTAHGSSVTIRLR